CQSMQLGIGIERYNSNQHSSLSLPVACRGDTVRPPAKTAGERTASLRRMIEQESAPESWGSISIRSDGKNSLTFS
ncbi:MAG: hypothetical protein KBA79_03125, partial [Candidatus Cloacimonetes bacterium]|nr:hypothetical protein [Candidatus Cloacimonadota bacterium]